MTADHSTATFTALADLASARVGGAAVAANDDFFASRTNLVKAAAPFFIPGKYTARGKWMDGWETRRRRTPGHDWCVVALGIRGAIRGIDVDTSYFDGNHPSHCSLEVLDSKTPPRSSVFRAAGPPWVEVLAQAPLEPATSNLFAIANDRPWSHVRLNIFPDGGVARLRVYGDPAVDWTGLRRERRAIDLASVRNGGLVLGASDMHFGAKDNLIMPGRARNMGDGWETRRRRGEGFDWVIVRLGTTGSVAKVDIDTNHFKGNYPESASLEACLAPGAPFEALQSPAIVWRELLRRTRLDADRRHLFAKELVDVGPVSHVRLNIFPDGGISRLRVHGYVAED
jgi:allantoicase